MREPDISVLMERCLHDLVWVRKFTAAPAAPTVTPYCRL